MGLDTYEPLIEKLRDALQRKKRVEALYVAMKRGRDSRAKTMQEYEDFGAFRQRTKEMKRKSVANLEALLEQFTAKAQEKGAHVFVAKDEKEAMGYVMNVAKKHGAKTIVKSKSLTTEEIRFNEPLEHAGHRVVETDLGERIIQLAGEKPFHLVFPAVHKTSDEVGEIFSKSSSENISGDLNEIMRFVRKDLREAFLSADIGVSGANVAVAESGTVIVETNEGNGRLVTSVPKIHIVVMGMEKIVPSFEDALYMVKSHAVNATGQRTTTYVSMITGRSPLNGDSSRELHVVVLDNGRRRMLNDPWFRDALSCIRCGACMNICAPYSVSGGHVFGYIYPGPIGIPWTANVHGLENAKFAHLCISCGLCKEICPVDIDIPMMIAKVKEQDVEKNGQLRVNRVLESYESIAPLASSLAPAWNWVMRRKLTRVLVEKLVGIDRGRPVPEFKRLTFSKWYGKHKVNSQAARQGKVALFVDFYANYVEPDLAKVVVELLEAAGVVVVVPEQRSSGYPFIAYGDLKKAEEAARFNVDNLYQCVKQGCDVVSIEPTATYVLRHSYPKLLVGSREAEEVASKSFEVFEYLSMLVQQGRLQLGKKLSGKAGFHIPCHERALSSGRHALSLLRSAGLEVEVRETGMCCGMAGTFGLKKGPLGKELSLAIGEPLFDLFKQGGYSYIVTESSVCKTQVEQGTGIKVVHPLTLVRDALIGVRR